MSPTYPQDYQSNRHPINPTERAYIELIVQRGDFGTYYDPKLNSYLYAYIYKYMDFGGQELLVEQDLVVPEPASEYSNLKWLGTRGYQFCRQAAKPIKSQVVVSPEYIFQED